MQLLNTGGMAEIFLANRLGPGQFNKKCVIKRLRPDFTGHPELLQMFQEEANLAARFQHQNLPQVFEVGWDEGLPFYAMEYLDGWDLSQLHRFAALQAGRRLPLQHVLYAIAQAATGLNYAHNVSDETGPLNVVHRDVSPANIFVTKYGDVKVVDFGIAHSREKSVKTETGALKGKLMYMSPEQTQGTNVDARSDIFSLGIVLYELTVGERPFDGPAGSSALIAAENIRSGRFEPPSRAVIGYPPDLETIVMKALAKDPADRFQSADEFAEALESFVDTSHLRSSARSLRSFVEDCMTGKGAPKTAVRVASQLKSEEFPRLASLIDTAQVSADQTQVDVPPTSSRRGSLLTAGLLVSLTAALVALAFVSTRNSPATEARHLGVPPQPATTNEPPSSHADVSAMPDASLEP